MYKISNKYIAALAVFAMMFAGFGAVFVAQADDAVVADPGDLIVTYDGMLSADVVAVADDYVFIAALDDDAEDKITVLNMDDFKNILKPKIKAGFVEFTTADLDAQGTFVSLLKTFTSAEVNKIGDITGGVQTKLTFADVYQESEKDVKVELMNADDAEAAVIIAVAAAVAEFDDYSSPEEVAAAVAAAVDAEKAKVAGYKYTQEDYDAALAVVPAGYISEAAAKAAQDAAVAKAIAEQPVVKADNTFEFAFYGALVIIIGLVAILVYFLVLVPRMEAKKAAAEQPKEQA